MFLNAGIVQSENIEAKYNLGEVLVSATKTEQYQAEVGSSTTVITSDDIEKKGKTSVLEYLREVPGVSITPPNTTSRSSSYIITGCPL